MSDKATIVKKRKAIDKFISSLEPRERCLLNLKFGLIDNKSRTLEEVGKYLGLTRERIRQMDAKILMKLRCFGEFKEFKEMFKKCLHDRK